MGLVDVRLLRLMKRSGCVGVLLGFESVQSERGSGLNKLKHLRIDFMEAVVLSFLAVLAALGLGGPRRWELTVFVVAGIFCGSMLWWTALSVAVMRFRARVDEHRLKWLNRLAGLAMAIFGAGLILLSRAAK